MWNWKASAKAALRSAGFDIRRVSPHPSPTDEDHVTRQVVGSVRNPVIFDVGANEGQSIAQFKELFRDCEIHAFEPSPATFQQLLETANLAGVRANQCGVGDESGVLHLQENTESTMTSFLAPGPDCWGEIGQTTPVPVITLDRYCDEQDIRFVDLLKTDTQGFDFQVVSGARNLLAANRIRAIKTELIFSELYQGQVPAEDYHKFLRSAGFHLVGYFEFGFQDGLLGWCDAIFVNPDARNPARDR